MQDIARWGNIAKKGACIAMGFALGDANME